MHEQERKGPGINIERGRKEGWPAPLSTDSRYGIHSLILLVLMLVGCAKNMSFDNRNTRPTWSFSQCNKNRWDLSEWVSEWMNEWTSERERVDRKMKHDWGVGCWPHTHAGNHSLSFMPWSLDTSSRLNKHKELVKTQRHPSNQQHDDSSSFAPLPSSPRSI